MKRDKLLFLCFFFVLVTLMGTGCGAFEKSRIRKVLSEELGLLKAMDQGTEPDLLSYDLLFPGGFSGEGSSDEAKNALSLFFRSFSYKIRSVEVNNPDHATVQAVLTTLDPVAVAKDFSASRLENEIYAMVDQSFSSSVQNNPFYLLHQLLNTRKYQTTTAEAEIFLEKENGEWGIVKSPALEDTLTGGLLSSLSDPYVLSPEETLQVYFDTIGKMDQVELESFLGIDALSEEADTNHQQIAKALASQIRQHFDYTILESAVSGYTSQVFANITTFSAQAILQAYETSIGEYLASADALIDGYDARMEKAGSFLLESIMANTEVEETSHSFLLHNDGISWKLDSPGESLGAALLGTLQNPDEAIEGSF